MFIKKKILILILIALFSVIISWYYWESNQIVSLKKSAQTFEQISSQLKTKSSTAIATAKKFANKTNNIYAALINIELSKIAVENNDISSAEKILLKTLTISKLNNLRDLINIKLARIQLALNNTEQALHTLDRVHKGNFIAVTENIRGDILLKRGDILGAHLAYSKGVELSETEIMKSILKIKINSLPNQRK